MAERTRAEKTKYLSSVAEYALEAKLGIQELEMN
jgi:hypothetical protein